MNKFTKVSLLGAIAAMILFAAGAVHAQKKPVAANHVAPSASEEYFMVSSVDKAHNALIVLRPTQITATLIVNDKTQFADENGKPIKLADLRTGDAIFASFTTQAGGVLTATHVRKGMMTMAEMRKRYLPGLPITTSPPGLGH
ncbi:MAG TPA: hypothetical protein VN774_00315 [Candidatus Limnocylindrales bacterium]|nr:hypothetical protein [Candidatus Limnocylindrales bacterium]